MKAPRGFSDEESFGLFMEGVREIQLYEDEAARTVSNPVHLREHLSDALDALRHCNKFYPDDLLPRYYFGIALTMENQCFYAELLRERQAAGGAMGRLEDRPWPLLDRALDCFNLNGDTDLTPELRNAAQFNMANVSARIGTYESYTQAMNILRHLMKPAVTPAPPPGWFDRVTAWVRSEAERRKADEARAFQLSAKILLAVAEAARAIRADGLKATAAVLASVAILTECREAAKDLSDSMARHDVIADALTKRGLTKYLYAVAEWPQLPPTLRPGPASVLDDARDDFLEALQHKPNWIPAQTYLAQVYQALGQTDSAEEQLSAILGKPADKAPESKESPAKFE